MAPELDDQASKASSPRARKERRTPKATQNRAAQATKRPVVTRPAVPEPVKPPDHPKLGKPKLRHQLPRYLAKPAVIAALILAAATIIAAKVESGGSTDNNSTLTSGGAATKSPYVLGGGKLTIRDVVNGGAWAVSSPTLTSIYPRQTMPANAKSWLPNYTVVTVSCAQVGTSYPVLNGSHHQRWHWWAKLSGSGLYTPIAVFQETVADGSEGFPTCHS
jgi:hypothetical protein